MQVLRDLFAAAALCALAGGSAAADFTFSGTITYNTDVVQVGFHLDQDATDVRMWTDSFMGGTNFDPITALWTLPSGDLVSENDDAAWIAPGQTYYDSGLVFSSLTAGDYVFTVAAFNNRAGNNLSDPFAFAGQTPVALADWCQPASNGCSNQKGGFWRMNLSGVDSAVPPVSPVPEPETYALMLGGLALVAATARRRRDRATRG